MDIDFKALVQTFLLEAQEQLGEMERALMEVEASPDEETLRAAFRAVHTLKGNASSVGFQGVTHQAHALEEGLEGMLEGGLEITSPIITLFLRGVDVLRESVSAAVAGVDEVRPDHEELIEDILRSVRRSGTNGEALRRGPERREGVGRRRDDVGGWNSRARTLRVPVEKLDQLLDLTGEIAIARGRLGQLLELGARKGDGEILQTHREADRLYMDLQELVMALRMVPVGPTFQQYQRTVRDLANAQGKLAQLTVEGGEVEVDMRVIEHLRDPLMHMIRNAVDHGIEAPERREAEGKDPCGKIVLKAAHEGGSVLVEVEDDGAGIDRGRVLQKARERGLAPGTEGVSEQAVHQLIFEPGFSTAPVVTELSGRGVGMDVVRRNVEALRGTVTVSSRALKGTTIGIRLPLTLAIIEGFSIGVARESYVIPLEALIECVEFSKEDGADADRNGVFYFRGKPLPYLRLRDFFGLEAPAPLREALVVVEHQGRRLGLVVEELYGHTQTVIKPLGKLFQGLPGVSGSAIRGDGRVALVLDIPGLLKEFLRQELEAEVTA